MKSSAPVCPVPTEQQPINEFRDLTESWFFRWATLDWWPYTRPLLVLWSLSWIIVWPMVALSFPPAKELGHFLVCGVLGACALPLMALLQLTLGWLYVRDRLCKETIFYEESGWYDGQTWTKPEEVLQRDLLIVNYQISPILQRLRRTFLVFAGLFVTSGLVWVLL